jgi:translation initiation factor IF-1
MRFGSPDTDRVETIATVQEVLSVRHCHATLPNGKVILAHVNKGVTVELQPGSKLRVSLSLCDFSHGEVCGFHSDSTAVA